MAQRISHALIEEIRLKNDIVTVIESYFNLQRKGSTIKALCPFHKEKTPSFVINLQRQIFHCFGCGAGGDVFQFIMKYENVDFMTAVNILARRAGVKLTFDKDHGPNKTNKEVLYEIHEKVTQLYHNILLKNCEAETARQYLKTRHFSKLDIEEFQIGFAPDKWDTVLKWAGKHYNSEQLESAGLVVRTSSVRASDSSHVKQGEVPSAESIGIKQKRSHCYDRFRNRLMFPIQDEQGRVVGFSGRILDDTAKSAKYINTPGTVLFHKGHLLFALYKARRAIVEAREAIVCEGQIDVIRCHTAGFKTAVAAQGTAFTVDHARMLKRYADVVVIVFDSDSAGQDAALRAADAFLQVDLVVRIASLPSEEDPDSLINRQHGKEIFQQVIKESKTALDFQIDVLNERDPLDTEIGLVRATSTVLDMISRTPNAVHQARLLRQAADRLKVTEETLRKEFQNIAKRRRYGVAESEPKSGSEPKSEVSRPIKEVALAEHLVADPLLSELVRTYLPLELISDSVCLQIIRALLDSEETDRGFLDVLSERDNDKREFTAFAAQLLSAPVRIKGELGTNEESVKSLILGIRVSALQRRRKEIEKLQIASRTGAGTKHISAEEKSVEMESSQIEYDIAKLKQWETAVPIMELTSLLRFTVQPGRNQKILSRKGAKPPRRI